LKAVEVVDHNGTFVNGIPVGRKFVEHGDTIRVGKSELVFLMHEGERPTLLLGIHPKYLHRLVRNLNLKSELR
jgi:pSer/pThr/pTyr-binding forkhead associated (FHA) protein